MSRPVSIIVPACSTSEDLADQMRPLLQEVEHRERGDEVIVIDDTGMASLRESFRRDFPTVGGVTHKRARGYARSLLSGAFTAKYDLVLCLAPGIRVRRDFLTPLVECMEDERVFAVSPRVVADGDPMTYTPCGSLFTPRAEDPMVPALEQLGVLDERAFLIRKQDLGGATLATLFEPACIDFSDLCRLAASRGARMVCLETSEVEHHTLDHDLPERDRLLRIARERNGLLSFWLHLEDPEIRQEHMKRLWHELLGVENRATAEDLRVLVLALEKIAELREARRASSQPSATSTPTQSSIAS